MKVYKMMDGDGSGVPSGPRAQIETLRFLLLNKTVEFYTGATGQTVHRFQLRLAISSSSYP